MPLYVEGSRSCLKALTITTGACRVQATNRRQSTWRNHPSSWFQLAKKRLTTNPVNTAKHLRPVEGAIADSNRTRPAVRALTKPSGRFTIST